MGWEANLGCWLIDGQWLRRFQVSTLARVAQTVKSGHELILVDDNKGGELIVGWQFLQALNTANFIFSTSLKQAEQRKEVWAKHFITSRNHTLDTNHSQIIYI